MNRPKVLLIDDSHYTLDLLEIFLYHKYEIYTAQNGFDGLNKAREHTPDCIVSDIMMPVMDGIKFFNNLKKHEELAHVPVVATTSFIRKLTTKSLLNIGFSTVVTKPFKLDVILQAVEKVLAETARAAAP